MLKPELAGKLIGENVPVRALLLSVRGEGKELRLFSAVDFRTFSMDKEPEQTWNTAVLKFLDNKGITYEVQ